LSLHAQVISLIVANNRLLLDVEVTKIKEFQRELLAFFDERYPEVGKEIEESRALSDELKQKVVDVTAEFKQKRV